MLKISETCCMYGRVAWPVSQFTLNGHGQHVNPFTRVGSSFSYFSPTYCGWGQAPFIWISSLFPAEFKTLGLVSGPKSRHRGITVIGRLGCTWACPGLTAVARNRDLYRCTALTDPVLMSVCLHRLMPLSQSNTTSLWLTLQSAAQVLCLCGL